MFSGRNKIAARRSSVRTAHRPSRRKLLAVLILVAAAGSCLQAQNINVPNKNGPMGTQVNTLTGNLFVPRHEIFVPARGIDLNITFYYNSFSYNINSGYGNGWGLSYGMHYHADSIGDITIVHEDGKEDTFLLSGGSFKAPIGIFDSLTLYETGKYLLRTKFGIKYYFDNSSTRRLTRIQDPNSNSVDLAYTSDTLLSTVTNAAGQSITLNYTQGLLSSVVDAMASPTRTYSYKYDGFQNLVQATDPLGNAIKYKYLVNGPLSQITDKNNNAIDIIYFPDFTVSELIGCNSHTSFSYDTSVEKTTVTDYVPTGNNQVTTYTYKKVNNLLWLTNINGNCCGYNMAFTFDNDGNVTQSTDANGNVNKYTYDKAGNVLTMTDPLSHTSAYTWSADYSQVTGYTDAAGNYYAVTYDKNGNPLQFTEPGNSPVKAAYSSLGDMNSFTDADGNVFNYTYDAYGYPSQMTGPLSLSSSYVFDPHGNPTAYTDPDGHLFSTQFDVMNRVTGLTDPQNHKILPTYDANDNITSITDQNGHQVQLGYDASDRVVSVTDALGKQSHCEYDAMDNLVKYTDRLGNATTINYDNLNRVSSMVDALGNRYSFEYDANGNRTSASYPNGNTVSTTYDKLDRPVSYSDLAGPLGSVNYDNTGNIISYTNGTGAVMTAAYDSRNRLVRVADPLGNSQAYVYDNNSNILSIKDRNAHTATYQYDALGRLTSSVDNNGFTTGAAYDAIGNMLSLTDQNNHTTRFTYDELNRPLSTIYPDGRTMSFVYDSKGNILSRQLADGSAIGYGYDAGNRMLTKTLPGNALFSYGYDVGGRLISGANAGGTVTLSYDALDRLAAESLNGHTTAYSYDMVAGVKHILYPDSSSITRNYDQRDRLVGIMKGNTPVVTYRYNNADQVSQINYNNGAGSTWQYDFSNRLSNIVTSSGNIQQSSFTYDNEMNKTAASRTGPQGSEQYSYDAGNRLIAYRQGATISNTYTYDAAGNRTAANLNGQTATYSLNALNQYSGISGAGQNLSLQYDGNGNLIFDGTYYKQYDAEGRLLSDSSGANRLYYQYDALGRRIQKKVNDVAVNYYYAGLSQAEQRDAHTDTLINELIYNGPLTPVLEAIDHHDYYYHQNELNSVEAITDANGALVERYQYDAYGKPVIYDSAGKVLVASLAGNRFAFTGQEYDAETGTYNFHFRNYSPSTGRFNQRDPIGYKDGTDIYEYVHDNPSNRVDPLGLKDCGNRVILITNQEWENEIKKMRQQFKNDHSVFVNKAQNFDSKFYSAAGEMGLGAADQSYSFRGQVYSGMEINYYFEGMLFAASGYSENNLNDAVAGWKQMRYGVTPTKGVMDMASLGFQETKRSMDADGDFHKEYNTADYSSYKDPSNLPQVPKDDSYHNYQLMVDPSTGTPYVKAYLPIGSEYDKGGIYMNANDQMAMKFSKLSRQGKLPVPARDDCPPNGTTGGTQKKTPPAPGHTGTTDSSTVIGPRDPNEIIGPDGVGIPKWMSVNATLPYTILYQNSPAASAPAKTVRINYPVDPKQDMNNFSLGNFGFNNLTFTIPANTPSYYQRLNAKDSLGLYIDVTAGLDVVNHQVFWTFQSLDPITLLPPSDPTKGFLLLTDSSKPNYGHGFVNFSIKPLMTDKTGDTTHAEAFIVFDSNDTVPTNAARNTIDAVAPTSHLSALPATSAGKTFTLSWSGSDDPGGSGLQYYTLYLAANGGAYTVYRAGITRTDTTFTGAENNTYSFFVLATDSAGNTETLRPDAAMTILISPVGLPVTWLSFTATLQGKDGLLDWATATESNSDHFGVERSNDGKNFEEIGTVAAAGNSVVQTDYSYTDKNLVSLAVPIVYYRLRQVDKDGKSTYSNVVALNLPAAGNLPKVTAYPNPFQQSLNLLIVNIPAGDPDDMVRLYTLDGKLVYQRKIAGRSLNGYLTLNDLPQLTPGVYVVNLTLNKQTYSFKVMKGSK